MELLKNKADYEVKKIEDTLEHICGKIKSKIKEMYLLPILNPDIIAKLYTKEQILAMMTGSLLFIIYLALKQNKTSEK